MVGEGKRTRLYRIPAQTRKGPQSPTQIARSTSGLFQRIQLILKGQSLLRLARQRLGKSLGNDMPAWTQDPQGRYLGGNEISLSMPEMVRCGEMYRLRGTFDETCVLSNEWIDTSFQPVTRSPWSGLRYGYGWFLGQSGGAEFALARGYGGQVTCVVPELGLTVAITSDPTRPARSGGYFGDFMQLIEGTILPVAQRNAT